jgi:hypothetical protein
MNVLKRRTLIAILSALVVWPVAQRLGPILLRERGLVMRGGWIVKDTDL